METRYLLKEEVDNNGFVYEPYLYTYEEAKDYIIGNYGFEKEVSDPIRENQEKVIEWIIDEEFHIINDEESYSWYKSMCELPSYYDKYEYWE